MDERPTASELHYRTNFRMEGNLRQLRSTLQAIREIYTDPEADFALWHEAPGGGQPGQTIEQFSVSFLLRRHEKRYRKGAAGRSRR